MRRDLAETAVRGVIECPGCSAPALWLAERDDAGAFVIRLTRPEASLLVREFSAVASPHAVTYSLVARIATAAGAQIIGVGMRPDGRGRIQAEIELVRDGQQVRVRAQLLDAAALAFRLKVPVRVPRSLLVRHDGSPVPSCPNEDAGLPRAPRDFMQFIERVTAEDFRSS